MVNPPAVKRTSGRSMLPQDRQGSAVGRGETTWAPCRPTLPWFQGAAIKQAVEGSNRGSAGGPKGGEGGRLRLLRLALVASLQAQLCTHEQVAPLFRVAKDHGELGQALDHGLQLLKIVIPGCAQFHQDVDVVNARWHLPGSEEKGLEVLFRGLLAKEPQLVW